MKFLGGTTTRVADIFRLSNCSKPLEESSFGRLNDAHCPWVLRAHGSVWECLASQKTGVQSRWTSAGVAQESVDQHSTPQFFVVLIEPSGEVSLIWTVENRTRRLGEAGEQDATVSAAARGIGCLYGSLNKFAKLLFIPEILKILVLQGRIRLVQRI